MGGLPGGLRGASSGRLSVLAAMDGSDDNPRVGNGISIRVTTTCKVVIYKGCSRKSDEVRTTDSVIIHL